MIARVYIGIILFSIDLKKEERKKQTYLLLEKMLSKYAGSKDIRIYKENSGKPVLLEPKKWHYNVSNSKNIAVCTISKCCIGVDIEKITTKRNFTEISKTWYSQEEHRQILESKEISHILFYHLWTRKEAYIKKIGNTVWSMKSVPCLNKYISNIRTWNILCGLENYSLSIVTESLANQKIEYIFSSEFTDNNLVVKPCPFFKK